MDLNRFTEKAQQAVLAAKNIAVRMNHQQIEVEHLLLALLDQEQGLVPAILNKADISPEAMKIRVQQELERLPRVTGQGGAPDQFYVSGRLNALFTRAEDEAKRLKDEYISVEHLLLAMIDDGGLAGRILKEFGVTRQRLMSALQSVRGHQRVTSQNPEETYQALERYGRDLTQYARQGKLDPVIGRDEEIRRVIQVLSRRTKNNPVLIGEPGVGKAQPLDARIKTPTGWKAMGEIRVGDLVSTPDGGTAPVIGVFPQGEKPIYRIHFKDGRWADACADHL